ncbi:MAG TPA: FtsX-like permease family protein [Ktedonobacteraceae bacterium]
MASVPSTLSRQRTLQLLPAMVKLAGWRLRQMWHVLFVTWLGVVAMVVLACSIPLFSQVAMTAGLRNALSSAPPNEQRLTFSLLNGQPSPSLISQAGQDIDQAVHSNLSSYVNGAAQFSVQTPALNILSPHGTTTSAQSTGPLINLSGYELNQVSNQITVLQGRLPNTSSNEIEIALTQATAKALKVGVGSIITAQFPQSASLVTWTLHVVGIFSPKSNWQSANTFQSQSLDSGTLYQSLASSQALLPRIASMEVQVAVGNRRVISKNDFFASFFRLNWSYPFDQSHIDINNLDALTQAAGNTQTQINNALNNLPGTLFGPQFSGSLFDILPDYVGRVTIGEALVSIMLVLTLGLVLFLVSMMSTALVERQTATIATLRSRGATRRHVFGTFVTQGIGLAIVALLVGPFISILLVRLIAQRLLPSADQSALNVLTDNVVNTVLRVWWVALLAVLFTVITMIVAVRRATALDVLAFRRESSRETHRSLWRRLNLDLFTAILVCAGYVAYAYLLGIYVQSFDKGLGIVLALLALLAPPIVLTAGLTIFLRLFPLLLRLGAWLASQGRKAPALLATAQMERSPRPAARMILLLALGIAFAFYTLTFIATQQQRVYDAAAYQVGADFSGPISQPAQTQTLARQTATYLHTPGVTSATLGYQGTLFSKENGTTTELVGVDANSFANTATWSSQYSSQSLSSLMTLLASHRADAAAHDVVYALVDDSMWKSLNLPVGATFILPTVDGYSTHFIIAGRVHSIPGVYDSPDAYGLLFDYQSYATVYAKDTGGTLPPNYAWLSTRSDAASLASVRHAFPMLQDRRAIIDSIQTDPLHINVINMLGIGVVTALLLALVGTLFSAWLNATGRLTNFAVLRALGMAPRHIAAVLLWELGSICIVALVLGIGLGYFLTLLIKPVLFITDFVGNINNATPIQIILPQFQLAIVLGAVVVICAVALVLMARLVSRPSLGQTLRLNED